MTFSARVHGTEPDGVDNLKTVWVTYTYGNDRLLVLDSRSTSTEDGADPTDLDGHAQRRRRRPERPPLHRPGRQRRRARRHRRQRRRLPLARQRGGRDPGPTSLDLGIDARRRHLRQHDQRVGHPDGGHDAAQRQDRDVPHRQRPSRRASRTDRRRHGDAPAPRRTRGSQIVATFGGEPTKAPSSDEAPFTVTELAHQPDLAPVGTGSLPGDPSGVSATLKTGVDTDRAAGRSRSSRRHRASRPARASQERHDQRRRRRVRSERLRLSRSARTRSRPTSAARSPLHPWATTATITHHPTTRSMAERLSWRADQGHLAVHRVLLAGRQPADPQRRQGRQHDPGEVQPRRRPRPEHPAAGSPKLVKLTTCGTAVPTDDSRGRRPSNSGLQVHRRPVPVQLEDRPRARPAATDSTSPSSTARRTAANVPAQVDPGQRETRRPLRGGGSLRFRRIGNHRRRPPVYGIRLIVEGRPHRRRRTDRACPDRRRRGVRGARAPLPGRRPVGPRTSSARRPMPTMPSRTRSSRPMPPSPAFGTGRRSGRGSCASSPTRRAIDAARPVGARAWRSAPPTPTRARRCDVPGPEDDVMAAETRGRAARRPRVAARRRPRGPRRAILPRPVRGRDRRDARASPAARSSRARRGRSAACGGPGADRGGRP